jgi:hypothetical protein
MFEGSCADNGYSGLSLSCWLDETEAIVYGKLIEVNPLRKPMTVAVNGMEGVLVDECDGPIGAGLELKLQIMDVFKGSIEAGDNIAIRLGYAQVRYFWPPVVMDENGNLKWFVDPQSIENNQGVLKQGMLVGFFLHHFEIDDNSFWSPVRKPLFAFSNDEEGVLELQETIGSSCVTPSYLELEGKTAAELSSIVSENISTCQDPPYSTVNRYADHPEYYMASVCVPLSALEDPEGCSYDTDCPGGFICVDGECQEVQ